MHEHREHKCRRSIDYGLGVLTARALADFPDTRAFDL
jgi:hypothetical protein